MSDLREALDAIESDIAQGDVTAAQVFTQMKHLVQSALGANGGKIPKLTAHAKVGAGIFHPGVSWETVIDKAMRDYEREQEHGNAPLVSPEQKQELQDLLSGQQLLACPNDTDGDGDCHLCARRPGGCCPPPSVAVPEGVNFDLISAVLEDYANLQTSGAIPCANRYSASDANEQAELLDALTAAPQPDHTGDANEVAEPFQTRVSGWMQECFGPEISADKVERNHRFLEEALELVQSLGCTKEEARQLVDYVYGRAVGDPPQEVGGVMVTLAALCLANGIDMDAAAETELARILQPEMVTKIREKQKRKPAFSPLPGSYPEREPALVVPDNWPEFKNTHDPIELVDQPIGSPAGDGEGE